MKRLIFPLVTLFVVFSLFSFLKNEDKQEGITFKSISFNEALKVSKSSNKLIFMDAYAVWCGPCKFMDKKTFTDPAVAAFFNDNFINLKVDMEKGEGPSLAKRFKVTAYPTLLFIDGNGEVFHKVLGAKQPEEFLKIAKDVVAKQ